MLESAFFIFGLVVGSFLNVCIYRIPKKESIVLPRSHCPDCNKTIPWYDNIPLLSYILLGRRCRFCKGRISPIYFTVELLTALVFLLMLEHFGLGVQFAVYTVLSCALIVVTFVDFKIQEIPDEITLSGMALGLVLSFAFPSLMQETLRMRAFIISVFGLLAGGLSIYAMGVLGKMLFKKEAMGGGDVKLLAMIGAFLGWKLAILIFFIAPFFGAIVGVLLKMKDGRDMIPYGPYLSLGTLVAILWGEKILSWTIFLR